MQRWPEATGMRAPGPTNSSTLAGPTLIEINLVNRTPFPEHGCMTTPELRRKLADEFSFQVGGCETIGSALYGELCRHAAEDVVSGGPVWEAMAKHAHLRFGLASPLRFLAALHRSALRGESPALARHYPSCGGTPGRTLREDFLAATAHHTERIAAELDWGVQTNEVVRTSALYPGLAHISALVGLPVSLREIGSSAGLNLRLDRFRFAQDRWSVGDPTSPVEIVDRWGDRVPGHVDAAIVDRAGCDPDPIDPTTDDGALHLLGFLWPDQLDRRGRTLAAIEIARNIPARVEQANAEGWLARELARRTEGAVTVIMHSIVWQYIDKVERARITDLIESVGATATPDTPLAWMSFEPHEPDRAHAALKLRYWDGQSTVGAPTLLAECGFHGQWVRWRA